MRLDQYVAQFWPEYSRATWQKFIKLGYVKVNGEPVLIVKHLLDEDDEVTIDIPDKPDFSEQSLPIVYEDDDVVVINKPAGVLTHSKGELNDEFTVAEFLRAKTTYHGDSNRPGIIHRLDRDTSGIILGVKNETAAKMLQKQFERRTVKKTYYAVLDGVPATEEAIIDVPIGRSPSAPSTFKPDTNGKSAQTYYKILATNGEKTLVKLQPKTGRTHQLRVHMKHLGTPIHGDIVYGTASDRLYLHAAELELTLPNGEHHTFSADVPPSFKEMIE